jgi:polyisoprenyl-phosphate glycosyltransferase
VLFDAEFGRLLARISGFRFGRKVGRFWMPAYIAEESIVGVRVSRTIRAIIITPVYDDWASFGRLLLELDEKLGEQHLDLTVLAVNDGSTLPPPEQFAQSFKTIQTIRILDLAVNLGHQRAIAVGLAFVNRLDADCTIVMDSDGEDKPSDVVRLLEFFSQDPECIHVVERGRRSESAFFKLGYFFYRLAFRYATGLNLTHGNFCLLPAQSVVAILHNSNTWNNLAASIVRSRLPYRTHRMDRGERYEGKSKMNFTSLILHGLSAISVYLDILSARLLIASALALVMLMTLVFAVVGIRISTDLAIPGWATFAIGLLGIIILQITILAFNILLTLLYNRNQALAVPASVDRLYVTSNRTIYSSNTSLKAQSAGR